MHGCAHQRYGSADTREHGSVPRIFGVINSPTGSRREAYRRLRALTATEALAIAQLRRYGYDRRVVNSGQIHSNTDTGGSKPDAGRGPRRFNARIIRVIDFDRALSAIGGHNAALLQMFYCDGESQALIGEALGVTETTVHRLLGPALKLLVAELDRRSLL